jgi:hypothetical protein
VRDPDPGATPIVAFEGSFIPGDYKKMRWVDRDPSGELMPDLLRLFVKHGYARADSFGASGPDPKVRLHFDLSWSEFLTALRDPPTGDAQLSDFLADARRLFGEEPSPAA